MGDPTFSRHCQIPSSRKSYIWTGPVLIFTCLLIFSSYHVRTIKDNGTRIFESPAPQITPPSSQPVSDRPLILYAYSESSWARPNLEFFIAHGLHASADFIFIFNGDTNASSLVPNESNIRYVTRDNTCYDLGAYAEVLMQDDLWKRYNRFIMLNASIRGPFIPYWADVCWSDRYLSKVTDEVKLVGMSMNCWPNPHVQSMIWATDSIGLALLLYPPPTTPNHAEWLDRLPHLDGWPGSAGKDHDFAAPVVGINGCFNSYFEAIEAEVGASSIIMSAGYKFDSMLTRFHSDPNYTEHCDPNHNEDMLMDKGYDGTNLHPYETIFAKTNRGIDPLTLDRLSDWTDGEKSFLRRKSSRGNSEPMTASLTAKIGSAVTTSTLAALVIGTNLEALERHGSKNEISKQT